MRLNEANKLRDTTCFLSRGDLIGYALDVCCNTLLTYLGILRQYLSNWVNLYYCTFLGTRHSNARQERRFMGHGFQVKRGRECHTATNTKMNNSTRMGVYSLNPYWFVNPTREKSSSYRSMFSSCTIGNTIIRP